MPDPQQQLTDPDVWLSKQGTGSPEGLTDPDQWMQQQNKPTAASAPNKRVDVGRGGVLSGLQGAEHIGPGPSSFQEKGQNLFGYISDPKVMFPTMATMAAAPFTAGMSVPASATIMGGVNAAATAAAHGQEAAAGIPQPPLKDEMLWSFAGGAAPEAFGLLPGRFHRTPAGEQAQKLLGNKAGLHEVADHPVIDFMHNIATAGMGGRGRMEAAQAARSGEELQSLINKSEEFAPASGAKLLPDVAQQGADIRSTILDRAGKFYGGVVAPAYQDFGPGEKYGRINVVRMDPKGNAYVSTVNDILKERSEVGKAMSASSDRMEQAALRDHYDSLTKEIENHLPQGGQVAWQKAKAAQGFYSKTWENPTVEQILQSPTKENEVLSLLYNPQGGGELGGKPLRTSDKPVVTGGVAPANTQQTGMVKAGTPPGTVPPAPPGKYTPRTMQVSKTNAELLKEAKNAMGQDEWNHTAVAAIQHIVEASTNDQGILDGARLKKLFEAMDPDVKDVLFSSKTGKQDELSNLINTIAYAERKPKSAAGTLFINIRQGAAIIGGLSAAAGLAGELMGNDSNTSRAGLVTGGALMFAPNIMARILTSPTARDWLTRSATAVSPTVKERMVQMAVKTALQYTGRSAMQQTQQKGPGDSQAPNNIRFSSTNPADQFLKPPPGTVPEPPK